MSHHNKNKKCFEIQRIYIKDISFEAPNTPKIFQKKWNPTITVNINNISKQVESNIFEIVLKISVVVKDLETLIFLCDVQQAGVFLINNLNTDELKHCISAYCPNILFPYARTCISTLVSYSSFPQLNLAPINFNDIFNKNIKK